MSWCVGWCHFVFGGIDLKTKVQGQESRLRLKYDGTRAEM
jgi:hypothetical protein